MDEARFLFDGARGGGQFLLIMPGMWLLHVPMRRPRPAVFRRDRRANSRERRRPPETAWLWYLALQKGESE